jgi:hypothetical protein
LIDLLDEFFFEVFVGNELGYASYIHFHVVQGQPAHDVET